MLHTDHPGPVNIGNPHEVSMLELAEWIRTLAESSSQIAFVERPEDDPKVRQPDITLARSRPRLGAAGDLEDGLKRTTRVVRPPSGRRRPAGTSVADRSCGPAHIAGIAPPRRGPRQTVGPALVDERLRPLGQYLFGERGCTGDAHPGQDVALADPTARCALRAQRHLPADQHGVAQVGQRRGVRRARRPRPCRRRRTMRPLRSATARPQPRRRPPSRRRSAPGRSVRGPPHRP